jgi:membrane protein implicated in regulation of membrane protease activity
MPAVPVLLALLAFDRVELGFTFAKELAIQLITLSTGILAISVTYAKEVLLKGSHSDVLSKIAWATHLIAIVCGIWSLMALTGTLMPVVPPASAAVPGFSANVRIPAAAQVFTFLLGTILLVIAFARQTPKPKGSLQKDEYCIVMLNDDVAPVRLGELSGDRWEVASVLRQDQSTLVVLLRRFEGGDS